MADIYSEAKHLWQLALKLQEGDLAQLIELRRQTKRLGIILTLEIQGVKYRRRSAASRDRRIQIRD